MTYVSQIRLIIILTVLLFSADNFLAQEDDVLQKYSIKKERILGEHYFTPTNEIRMPFILTHVRTSLGVGGVSNIKYPLIEIGENEYFYMQGDVFVAILNFEYQHAIKHWLAVFTRFGLTGRLGNSLATLTKQGINYATTFDIGWMLRVYRNDKFALSASVEVTNGNYSFIDLQKFVKDIMDGMEDASLTRSNNSVYGLAGIKAAYGINEFIGLNAVLDIGYGETIQRELNNEFFTFSALNVDLNFYKIINTPLSLSLGYLHSTYPRTNNSESFSSNVFITQLNYIGTTDFVLSLDLFFSRELSNSINPVVWVSSAMFSMRFMF